LRKSGVLHGLTRVPRIHARTTRIVLQAGSNAVLKSTGCFQFSLDILRAFGFDTF
jgi:threonyl-tRNA synthetase